MKTPERHQFRRSGVFIVNFEYMSYFVLVFLSSWKDTVDYFVG